MKTSLSEGSTSCIFSNDYDAVSTIVLLVYRIRTLSLTQESTASFYVHYVNIFLYTHTHTQTHIKFITTENVYRSGIFSKYFMSTKVRIKMFSFITTHFYFLDYSRPTNNLMIGTHL